MADTTDTITIYQTPHKIARRLLNIYVDTGNSDTVMFDKSGLTGPNGLEPSKLVIKEVQWSIQGYPYVLIEWDHTTDDEAVVLGEGSGYFDYSAFGGLVDPASAGGTGDIIFTTGGTPSAGWSYDITLVVEKRD